jgi:hypothetical protein
MNYQGYLIDKSKSILAQKFSQLGDMAEPAEGNHAEGVPETVHQVSRDGFIIQHPLLNQVVPKRAINSLHEILDLDYGLLDQLRLVLLLVLFCLFGLPLGLPVDAHQSQHALDGHYDKIVDVSAEGAEEVDNGEADEGGGGDGEACVDGVVLRVIEEDAELVSALAAGGGLQGE